MSGATESFWDRAQRGDDDECWEWRAGKTSDGYGSVYLEGKCLLAHRVAFELSVEPIPDGMVVMHTCDNPPCVNPRHLRIGTHADNMADMAAKGRHRSPNAEKTHCKNGHPFDETNTYLWREARYCKTCRAEAMLRLRKRRSAA